LEKAFKVIVSGRVTGIGFRYQALDYASSLPGLKGHVMNLERGKVEALVQGPEDLAGRMIDWLRLGSPGARIDAFEIAEIPPDPSAGPFTIKHSWRI
jgi:acylphosphatase